MSQPTDDSASQPSRKRKSRLRRAAFWLAMTAVIAGGVTWYAYYYVFKAGFAAVVPGEVYRSSQPSPAEFRTLVKRYDLRTLICLRGDDEPEVKHVEKVADEMGVKFVPISLNAGKLPKPDQMHKLIDALNHMPRPILIHCRQGVDRTGMVSAVAALIIGHESFAESLSQLPLLRANHQHTHISDVLAQYKGYCLRDDKDANDPNQFEQWAKDIYRGEPTNDPQLVPKIPFFPDE